MELSTLSPLAALVSCQFLIYGVGWGLAAAFMPQHRRAAMHWSAFMLLLGLASLLNAARTEPRTFGPYVLGNILFVWAFVAMRRGMQCFVGARPPGDREHLAVALGSALVFVALGPSRETASWRVLLCFGLLAWLSLRAFVDSRPALVREFSLRSERWRSVPMVLLILLFGGRALQQLADMSVPREAHIATVQNLTSFYGYLVGAAVFNFSFLSLLIQRILSHLHHLSRHDALTGLLNRRALESALQLEWQRAHRHDRGLAVVALDLDHFKRVNDQHGHPAGDAVLREAAARLQRIARQTDTVARTGGEEFVVLMPEADADGARRAVERMLAELRARPVDLPGAALRCTASAGLAMQRGDDPDAQALLARADRALYQAKADGRDRVVADA